MKNSVMVSIYYHSPSITKPLSLILGGCGLNGDVIRAQSKSILHLHVCKADRANKWIASGPKRIPAQALHREKPTG